MKILRRFIRDERGIETSEYAITLVLIVVALMAAVLLLVNELENRFTSTGDTFNSPP